MFTPPAYATVHDEVRRSGLVARRVQHLLQRLHGGVAGRDARVRRRDGGEAAGGERGDPEHVRVDELPGHGGVPGRRGQRGAQRHREPAAAEPPRALRRAQRSCRIRPRALHRRLRLRVSERSIDLIVWTVRVGLNFD